MTIKPLYIGIGAVAFLILFANSAWAVQTHGGTEGLVVHQVGHLLFATGMGYLLLRLYRIQLTSYGWLEFKVFLWLIIFWNMLTFSGHWLDEFVAKEKFIQSNGDTVAFSVTNSIDAWFYLTRLDHLLLVPSFVFLLLALRKWRIQ